MTTVTPHKKKTAVFLTQRYVENLNLEAVHGLQEYRLVAIVDETLRRKFPKDKEHLFSTIHSVEVAPDQHSLLPELHYAQTRDILRDEITLAGSAECLGVVCPDEGNVLLAARLRDEFGITGLRHQQALLFRNKLAMKDELGKHGVRVPRHLAIDYSALTSDIEGYHKFLSDKLGSQFIMKPVQEVSGFGVFKVNSPDDIREYGKLIFSIPYEAEEFIAGKLYHVDSLIQNGHTVFAECGELTWPVLDYTQGRPLGSLPLLHGDPLRFRILDFAEHVLTVLGKPSGATHMEVFVTPSNELVFLEVASRIPGGLIVPMYERTYGINMLTADLLIQIGVPISHQRRCFMHAFWAIFPGASGRVTDLLPPRLESEHCLEWLVKRGDELRDGSSMLDKVATLVAWNDDYTSIKRDFEQLRNHRAIRVVPHGIYDLASFFGAEIDGRDLARSRPINGGR